jgi:hypothetical protein
METVFRGRLKKCSQLKCQIHGKIIALIAYFYANKAIILAW